MLNNFSTLLSKTKESIKNANLDRFPLFVCGRPILLALELCNLGALGTLTLRLSGRLPLGGHQLPRLRVARGAAGGVARVGGLVQHLGARGAVAVARGRVAAGVKRRESLLPREVPARRVQHRVQLDGRRAGGDGGDARLGQQVLGAHRPLLILRRRRTQAPHWSTPWKILKYCLKIGILVNNCHSMHFFLLCC